MATFAVNFRVAETGDHHQRRGSIIAAIERNARYNLTWDEMTSHHMVMSDLSVEALANAIYLGSSISPFTDKLLVIDLNNRAYATRGNITDQALLAAMFANSGSTLGQLLIR